MLAEASVLFAVVGSAGPAYLLFWFWRNGKFHGMLTGRYW